MNSSGIFPIFEKFVQLASLNRAAGVMARWLCGLPREVGGSRLPHGNVD